MKIAHVFVNFPSASQLYNLKLINRLESVGIHCEIVTFSKKTKFKDFKIISVAHDRYNWFVYVVRSIYNFKLFKLYKKTTKLNHKRAIYYFGRFSILLKINPNVVHVHNVQLLQPSFLHFLKVCNFKCVVSFRGGDLLVRPLRSQKDTYFVVHVAEAIKNIHFVSNNLKMSLIKLKPKNINSFVIHRRAETDNIIINNNTASNTPNILTIGRIHWTKGYQIALKALYLLKGSGIQFYYHICGGYSNEQKDELNYWIAQYELEDNIIFHGHLNSKQIDNLFSLATIYLQSSLSEGIPNTLLRALHNRIPTVTTDAGGISEIFQDNIDGFLVEKGNPEALFMKLKELILNQKLQDQIKNNSNILISNYQQEVNMYKEMYSEVYSN